jgi:hypothetical protein
VRNIEVKEKSTLKSACPDNFCSLLSFCSRFFPRAARGRQKNIPSSLRFLLTAAFIIASAADVYPQARNYVGKGTSPLNTSNTSPAVVRLTELIPKPYFERYTRWKGFLLSTETGRRLWKKFADNPAFSLTVIVSESMKDGAKVDYHRWNEGKLVGVTIILGHHLNRGYPNPYHYPVLGSLEFVLEDDHPENDDILAAAKFAHELGHIEHAASDPTKYKLQNELAAVFFKRFSSNGLNPADPFLKELADRMGGVPTKISDERENRAEVAALDYLMEELGNKKLRKLLKFVQRSIRPEFKYLFSNIIDTAKDSTTTSLLSDDADVDPRLGEARFRRLNPGDETTL